MIDIIYPLSKRTPYTQGSPRNVIYGRRRRQSGAKLALEKVVRKTGAVLPEVKDSCHSRTVGGLVVTQTEIHQRLHEMESNYWRVRIKSQYVKHSLHFPTLSCVLGLTPKGYNDFSPAQSGNSPLMVLKE